MKVATCAAPTNIAVVKYWGKADARLNTPLNSSVSVTLDAALLRATTSVAADARFERTRLWLNGSEAPINARTEAVLRELRALATDRKAAAQHLHIVSENSFPTAAGLASSAAGFACLVAAVAELLGVREAFPGQLSAIARQGSGSACRSLAGGFVRWDKGGGEQCADGSDSIAVQVADEHHWPELCAVVCVVNDRAKDTSSTSGMQHTKRTSELLRFRVDQGPSVVLLLAVLSSVSDPALT
jgi:diphosphomevalonate decarboxylase